MTLRLILMRHAKSSWGGPSLDDHQRPLSRRGEKAARAVGTWLASRGYVPAQALVSSSRRTRQTWDLVAQAFDTAPDASFEDALYLAEPDALMTALHRARATPLIMIGHNPGIAYFAQALASAAPGDSRFERFPTGTAAVIDFDAADWTEVAWKSGRIRDIAFPRDLV